MRRNNAAILGGGLLVGLQAGLAFGLSSAAPLLGVFHPFESVLGLRAEPVLGILRLLGGIPGGFLAGFASRNRAGEPDAIRGLLSGLAAGLTGLVLAYAAYLLVIVGSVAVGRSLPLSPIYLGTVVPLALGASALVTVPIGALLAGSVGGLVADPATDVLELIAPREASTPADEEPSEEDSSAVPGAVAELTEQAVYAPADADLEALVALLDRPDPAIREAAVRALASVPRSHVDAVVDAVPGLIAALDHDDRAVRHKAGEALARIAEVDPGAVTPAAGALAERIPDADVRVRNHLTEALRHAVAAEPERGDVVLDLLEVEDSAVRGAAVTVLGSAPSAAAPALDRLIDLFIERSSNRDEIAPLLAVAAREDPASVARAAPALVEYVADEPAAREAAIEALSLIATHDPAAARPAIDVLADALCRTEEPRRGTVAEGVVAVLRELPEAGDAVAEALSAGDSWQRFGAERALEEAADGSLDELL